MKIISCGVGTQGAIPKSVIRNGADFEIIGRYIYESENPRKKNSKIYKHEIKEKMTAQ